MNQRLGRTIAVWSMGIAFFLLVSPIQASDWDDDPERTASLLMTIPTQQSIDRGLEYLASRQNDDGSFGKGVYARNVGICSLAGMAFMSSGSTPGRGKYGRHVRKCVEFVLSQVQDNGFISHSASQSHGPMYGHGFATLFLSEVYGMAPGMAIREKLTRAIRLIVDTQNRDGGWRYQPQRQEADISVTICQLMALRSARNAGIYVPKATIDRCIAYIKRSQNSDGGFMYMLEGGVSAFPRSAAGVVALYSAGIYRGEELEKGLDYLMGHLPTGGVNLNERYFFYGHYYAVQAMWHAGGRRWQVWYPAIRDLLIQRQSEEGHWMDAVSPDYGTAMACIILQMPNNYLPIFQR